MSTIDELRGLWTDVSEGLTHIAVCRECGDGPLCQSGKAAIVARDEFNARFPALLDVAEAAKKLVQHTADFDLETALARLDGEVKP